MMKTVLQNIKTGVISVAQIPEPILKPGAVLVRNHCSVVSSGTEKAILEFSKSGYIKKAMARPDLFRKVINRAKNEGLYETYKVVRELVDQQIQLGYSSCGTVIDTGAGIDDLQVGQRVACAGLFFATHSEVICVPRNLVAPLPDNVASEQAAFVTLGAIGMQGLRLADISLGETVLIYGLGLVGMITAQLAVAAGARVIGTDVDPGKIAAAQDQGFEAYLINPDLERLVLKISDGHGVDKVVLCAATDSNEPIEKIPDLLRQKGILVVVGDVKMDIPRRAYYDKEIDIKVSRSYGPGRYDLSYEISGIDYPYAYVRWTENRNMTAVVDLLSRDRIDFSPLISHRFDLDAATEAYQLIEGGGRQEFLGVLIDYPLQTMQTGRSEASPVTDKPLATRKTSGVGIGVIGAGNFGKAFLLPALKDAPHCNLVGICTASGVSAAAIAKKYGMPLATSDPDEIFRHADVDAVVIATRHDSHADYVMRALAAGKAIFVEKPIATRAQDLEAIRGAYNDRIESGQQPFLMVGYNRRFAPLALKIKPIFDSGKRPLTIVYRVNAGQVAPGEWVTDPEQGGGRIIGEGCHFIDFMNYLVGRPARRVSAAAPRMEGRRVPDSISLTLEYPDGSIGSLHYVSSGNPRLPKEYIEVYGGGVSAQLLNFRKLKVQGAAVSGKKSFINQDKGFRQEAAALTTALHQSQPSPISIDDVYNSARVTFLVEKALSSGRSIDIDPYRRND